MNNRPNPGYIRTIQINKPLPGNRYWEHLPAVKSLAETPLCLQSPVTVLIGENGTGKSTLLEAIAVAYGFNPEGGSRNFHFATHDSHADLHAFLQLGKAAFAKDGYFLRAESFYNVASNIDELDQQPAFSPPVIEGYGGVSLHCKSHGESFLALVQNRLRGQGLYIFDEPEAALSPMRLLTLLSEIHRLVQADSQLIIATHSPILMTYPGAAVWQLSEKGLEAIPYAQTEHYQVTKQILNDPESFLRHLL